jgi:3-isopropylmalate dehydrogenase
VKLLVLPGDGIGPEITRATVDVLRRADAVFGLGLVTEEHEIGLARLARDGKQVFALQRRERADECRLAGPGRSALGGC